MELTLRLNARFQPRHRFDLEDALQELLERENMGEVTGGVRHKWKNKKKRKPLIIQGAGLTDLLN